MATPTRMGMHVEHHMLFTAIYWRGMLASLIFGGSISERRQLTEEQLHVASTWSARGW